MTKFNKFLDESNIKKDEPTGDIKKENKDYNSLKIKNNTLDDLRILKSVTRSQSYSSLIDNMIEVYLDQLSEDEKMFIKLLKNKK